jgi:hypothetical protein
MLKTTRELIAWLSLLLAGHMSLEIGRKALLWDEEYRARQVTIGVIGGPVAP